MKDKLECKSVETEQGIRIEVVLKDPGKKRVFQALVKPEGLLRNLKFQLLLMVTARGNPRSRWEGRVRLI